jgi:hypothetical protein
MLSSKTCGKVPRAASRDALTAKTAGFRKPRSAGRALFGARRHHYTPTGRVLKIVVPSIKIVSDIAHLTLQSDR